MSVSMKIVLCVALLAVVATAQVTTLSKAVTTPSSPSGDYAEAPISADYADAPASGDYTDYAQAPLGDYAGDYAQGPAGDYAQAPMGDYAGDYSPPTPAMGPGVMPANKPTVAPIIAKPTIATPTPAPAPAPTPAPAPAPAVAPAPAPAPSAAFRASAAFVAVGAVAAALFA